MKNAILVLASLGALSAQAADWTFTPKLYVRGGFTQSLDLDAKGNGVTNFNPGSWGGESNAFMNNLTEGDLHAMYGDKLKIVYGMNFDETTRFEDSAGKNKTYRERQAYMEIYKAFNDKTTLWFGRRPYRGYGDYLDGSFPLDERNMFGGGIMIDNVGPGRYEFAYGTNDSGEVVTGDDDNFTTNFFLNKYIYNIENGNITANVEWHQNNSKYSQYESNGFMAGAQYAKWNMNFLGNSWYNIFVLNYSNGHTGDVEAGLLASVFDSKDKDEKAQKVLFKIGGDIKGPKWGAFYNMRYQWHMGDLKDADGKAYAGQDWHFVDFHVRPMYSLNDNIGLGFDGVARLILKESSDEAQTAVTSDNWTFHGQNMWRAGLIGTYHFTDGGKNMFENKEISIIVGRAHQQNEKEFFKGREAKNDANFVRFKYTMEI